MSASVSSEALPVTVQAVRTCRWNVTSPCAWRFDRRCALVLRSLVPQCRSRNTPILTAPPTVLQQAFIPNGILKLVTALQPKCFPVQNQSRSRWVGNNVPNKTCRQQSQCQQSHCQQSTASKTIAVYLVTSTQPDACYCLQHTARALMAALSNRQSLGQWINTGYFRATMCHLVCLAACSSRSNIPSFYDPWKYLYLWFENSAVTDSVCLLSLLAHNFWFMRHPRVSFFPFITA